jgi:hypothetical protein
MKQKKLKRSIDTYYLNRKEGVHNNNKNSNSIHIINKNVFPSSQYQQQAKETQGQYKTQHARRGP